MKKLNLYVVLLGGAQKDDKIEAHNFFAGVAETMEALLPCMKKEWSGVNHIDAYMTLKQLDGYNIIVRELEKGEVPDENNYPKLMVYNIGYYKPGQFAEFHKLIPMVLKDKEDNWRNRLKADPDFAGGQALDEIARSHVDDKLKVSNITFDADNVIDLQKEIPGYVIELIPMKEGDERKENLLELGYLFVREFKELL